MKLLHAAFKRGDTSVLVRARRGDRAAQLELHACIVPHPSAGRRQYVLRSIRDPNYALGLVDRSESECIALQGSRSSRVVCALSNAQLKDGYITFPWEKKARDLLPMPYSSAFLSLIILPRASDPSGARYSSLEDTLAQANAWLVSSQDAGVPIAFMNIQTEALLTKIQGETSSRTVSSGSAAATDLSNLANINMCEFEDYHGIDIGVIRAVRLWYTPAAGETALEIKLQERDTKLGFAISRTDEGFIYISSVADDDSVGVAAARTRLGELYRRATRASKLLVVSRVGNEKVLPWMVSASGSIRCFDTVSLSQKLSLHRHALKPILLHLFTWEPSAAPAAIPRVAPPRAPAEEKAPAPTSPSFAPPSPVDEVLDDLVYDISFGGRLGKAAIGDVSLRFRLSDASSD
ncbi:hypothetical protein MUK42_31324 [Musa troglodytarum]|uniref:Uncharacterized protein n=1 Tax=Musa troglodytarum TaxID=320322 RepID=A0A9E7FG44_9LILI|nr:hypothetical protein MUK42_31324 [Musa troglodytarum]